jgi:hypothetical protein
LPFPFFNRTPRVKRFLIFVGFGVAACSPQHPQVLTPVVLDTASRTVRVASAPASTATSSPRTTADDPLARIDRMDWPGPNVYRAASGMPGPDYWQQRADYTIAATLDTAQ